MGFPETWDELKGRFCSRWADHINHPWKAELQFLEYRFWTALEIDGGRLIWTQELQMMYKKINRILFAISSTFPRNIVCRYSHRNRDY
jgi:hypothetical protein